MYSNLLLGFRKLDWISVNAFDLFDPRIQTLQHHTALYSSAKASKQDKDLNVVRCNNQPVSFRRAHVENIRVN